METSIDDGLRVVETIEVFHFSIVIDSHVIRLANMVENSVGRYREWQSVDRHTRHDPHRKVTIAQTASAGKMRVMGIKINENDVPFKRLGLLRRWLSSDPVDKLAGFRDHGLQA